MRKSWSNNIWRRLAGSSEGAVAPTIAISLFALVAMGGVAFDYSRLASMDSELQNAADQAALAAASQLDQETGAVARAIAAAQGLIANQTIMANDGSANAIGIPVVMFYETKPDAENNTNGFTDPARFEDANFVRVAVQGREAFYALTPIVGVFSSGDIGAEAVAGLGSAICKTPPVMMCNPNEPAGNLNEDYDFTPVAGDGLRLVIGSATAPGNFGFLQTGFGTGAQALAKAIGYDTPPADCIATDGVATEPGDKEAVRAAFNTRFDMSESGQNCPGTGTCSPSRNARKDLVRGNVCSSSGNQAYQEAPDPYRPTSPTTPLDGTNDPDIMGYSRDMCHAVSLNGVCETDGDTSTVADIKGDGEWDRDAYFRVNYGWNGTQWPTNTGLLSTATRYQVYMWEMANPAQSDMIQNVGSLHGDSYPTCRPPGVTPNATTPDRRRISVAVVNCRAQGLNGREEDVGVIKWMEVFLTEPAFARGSGPSARTGNGDIYVEVIGETTTGAAGQTAGQVVRRDVPYLIK